MVHQCFTEKHRWALKNHLMTGITLRPWLRILWRHGASLDWWLYWHRALFLTAAAVVNSCAAALEALLFGRRWAQQPLHPEPVFILGHPRTGTTHLHNLLAQGDFATATTMQAGFPSSFLLTEKFQWLLAPLMDRTRPMDNMALSFKTPAEDEIAVNVLTGGVSPYMPITLMRSHRQFFKYFTFEEAEPGELQAWTDAFLGFLRKVTYRHSRGSSQPMPLVIKSPVHTARVALLLKLFPRAKFIYIHRHPLQVFQSAANMADTYYWYCYLQRPTDQEVTGFIIDQYKLLFAAYTRDRALIPPGNLIELSFDELEADPLGMLRRVYERFGWGDTRFAALRPALEAYCATLGDFKKNMHTRLTHQVEALVRQEWGPSFMEFGYS